jgi:hypothetical protein
VRAVLRRPRHMGVIFLLLLLAAVVVVSFVVEIAIDVVIERDRRREAEFRAGLDA